MNQDRFEELKKEYAAGGTVPAELAEYRVDNAVILAAGVTSDTIYAPPKGLFLIDGIPIIERQICQLKEAGINDIYVVVGYKKEMYFYLEDKYGITLIGNPRLDKNNIYSLYLARNYLKNTYVCACDYYFKENPFSAFEYRAYHGTTYLSDAHTKFVVKMNHKGRIIDVIAGAPEGECIHGIAYFDRDFSESFVRFMEAEINNYRIAPLFWQEFFARHIDDLDLYTKHFDSSDALEFDDLRALRSMSLLFVNSVSTQIVKNICEQLGCTEEDITYVDILDAGHSNITFKVFADGKDYVYRYPGVSGKNIVSRVRETFSNTLGKKLGIDNTLLFIDASGHKLSTFVPNAHPLDPKNQSEIGALARLVRRLHDHEITAEEKEKYAFDPIKEADRLLQLSCANKDNLFEIFKGTREAVHQISEVLEQDHFKKAICHCNLNSNNCLITDHSFDLIDWEFSGYCDIAYDFPFLGNYDFREEDLFAYLTDYYGRKPTDDEYRHWLCYRAVHYWYYTCWAIYKESVNEDCGNLLLVFYEDCKKTVGLAQRYITLK
jgi:CTP:phosphocholine cytidylyltransferase-like protein/thiamine kinase-like enzyme